MKTEPVLCSRGDNDTSMWALAWLECGIWVQYPYLVFVSNMNELTALGGLKSQLIVMTLAAPPEDPALAPSTHVFFFNFFFLGKQKG